MECVRNARKRLRNPRHYQFGTTNKASKICENQQRYNEKMKKQRQQFKKISFKVDDLVAIEIHKGDTVSNLHANMLIAKILEIDSTTNYVKVVTQYGIMKGQIELSLVQPQK